MMIRRFSWSTIAMALTLLLATACGQGARAASLPRLLSDAAWGRNVRVNDDAGTASKVWGPSIAVDPSGNAYAVWEDERNGDYDIYFSYRPVAGSWSTNLKVNDDAGTAYQRNPSIAVDPSGNAYAVWHDGRNGLYGIYFSYRPAGGSWDTNIRVNDVTANEYNASIAVDPSGNAYVVWREGSDIYFSYRPAGASWGPNIKVNDDAGTADQHYPSIAVDSGGNAYAVWMDERNGDCDIYFSYRPAAGSWGANVQVNDDEDTAYHGDPSIAVDASGNAYAVWADTRNGAPYIYFSYRPAGGSWSANVRVDDDPGIPFQEYPSIAVDPSGNAYAVWQDDRNGDYDIYVSYCPADSDWGPSAKINDDEGTAGQGGANIAVDPSGNAYAVWIDGRNLGDPDIYFSSNWWAFRAYVPLTLRNYQ